MMLCSPLPFPRMPGTILNLKFEIVITFLTQRLLYLGLLSFFVCFQIIERLDFVNRRRTRPLHSTPHDTCISFIERQCVVDGIHERSRGGCKLPAHPEWMSFYSKMCIFCVFTNTYHRWLRWVAWRSIPVFYQSNSSNLKQRVENYLPSNVHKSHQWFFHIEEILSLLFLIRKKEHLA